MEKIRNFLIKKEKIENIENSPEFTLKTHKYDVVEEKSLTENWGNNPTTKEMKLKIALEEAQNNFRVFTKIKFDSYSDFLFKRKWKKSIPNFKSSFPSQNKKTSS